MNCRFSFRLTLMASSLLGAGMPLAFAQDITTVTSGSTLSTQVVLKGTDQLTVDAGGTLNVTDDDAVHWKGASTGVEIDNYGTIESTAAGDRAIDTSGSTLDPRTITLNNYAGAVITSPDDAFRIDLDITGGVVTVNNAGTIESTAGGQAIDFDNVDSTNGSSAAEIIINNLAGGLIKADDADGIRPGEDAVVNNYGTIYSDGELGDSHDGIDFQEHSGTVNNYAGGLISGQRHGITSSVNVDVYNAAGAEIIGRNGSGVGSDGTGAVVNYGTIIGAYVGTGDGDGDGVDIDDYGTVDNYGTIEGTGAGGVDKTGQPNGSEGVVITGGAIIDNHAGALISGVWHGITAAGDVTITNAGTIEGGTTGVYYISDLGDPNNLVTLTNSGTITGPDAIDFGGLNGSLIIEAGSVINGTVEGGGTDDRLILDDGAVFNTQTGFTSLEVNGSATLSGDNTIPVTTINTGARLQLGEGATTGFVTGAITDNGTLAVDRSDTVSFDSPITGSGGLEQDGAGTTIIDVADSYAGTTAVNAGTLEAGADNVLSPASAYSIAAGATLNLAGHSETINSLTNAGNLVLGGTFGLSTLTITGAYVGENGTLALDVNQASHTSDAVVLNGPGASASGHTYLSFNETGGLGKPTTGNGIEVISAINGATTTNDAFSMAKGAVASGAYEYTLHEVTTDGQDDWYLGSAFRPADATYSAIPSFAANLSAIGSFDQREGGSARASVDSSVWVRILGQTGQRNSGDFLADGPSYSFNSAGVQAGVDVYNSYQSDSSDAFGIGTQTGVYLSASHGNARVDSPTEGLASGSLSGRAYSLGGYWTHFFAASVYVDAVAQATQYNHLEAMDSLSDGSLSVDGHGYSASIEAGVVPFHVGGGLMLAPEAQLIASRMDIDDGSDQASTVAFNHPWQWTARVGTRVIFAQTDSNSVWSTVNINHSFGAAARTTLAVLDGDNPVAFDASPGSSWVDAGFGLTQRWTKALSTFTELDMDLPVGGQASQRGISAEVGFKYGW